MTAKHSDQQEPSAPPCYISLEDVERVVSNHVAKMIEVERKTLGRLNGPWVRGFKFVISVVTPIVCAAVGWIATQMMVLNARITELEKNYAVIQQVVSQIKTNTETLGRHEKELGINAQAIVALTKELGTSDQRYMMFVTRREWELRNEIRDREMGENRTAHEAIMVKLDRLIERVK